MTDVKIPIPTPGHREIRLADCLANHSPMLRHIVKMSLAAHHVEKVGVSAENAKMERLANKIFANNWTTREPFQAPDKRMLEESYKVLVGRLNDATPLPPSRCEEKTCRNRYGLGCRHTLLVPLKDRAMGAPVYVRLAPFGRRSDGSIIAVFEMVDENGVAIPEFGAEGIERHPKYKNSAELHEAVARAHDHWLKSQVRKYNEALAVFWGRCCLVDKSNNKPTSLPAIQDFKEVYRYGPQPGVDIFEDPWAEEI